MQLETIRDNIKNFGLSRAVSDIGLRAANRLLPVKILKAIRIEAVNRDFLECHERYRGLFLDTSTLRALAAEPKNELSQAFLDEAIAKGDECYAFLAGSDLAAYGWYSSKPTAIGLPRLRLHFNDQYVYMYKGFTAVSHRGQRLHAIGMTRALASYLARGYRGIVSYVEWNNFGSLRSCYRMGYQDFGDIAIASVGKHYLIHHDAGCRQYGFRVEPIEESVETAIRQDADPVPSASVGSWTDTLSIRER